MNLTRTLAPGMAVAVSLGALLTGCSSTSAAVKPCPSPVAAPPVGDPAIRRGPNPTEASAAATTGPFAISQTSVTGQTGFAGGTIYHPSAPISGTWGGIVLAPPFQINSVALAPMASRLASHGFVVLAFDANSTSDQPTARATQAKAAFTYLTDRSSVAAKVDRNRLAIGGYSMGGGATLEVARDLPALKAALPMVPWNTTKDFSTVRVPTMIVAAETDSVAAAASHAVPFYNSISAAPKAFIEVSKASHFLPTQPTASMTRYAVSWMKRWVDGDPRYTPFITAKASDLSQFQTCSVS